MQTEMFMKATEKMIKHMAMDFIFIMMAQNMKDSGLMINNMEMALKYDQMGLNIKENMKTDLNMEEENLNGLIIALMKEIFVKIIYMAKEFIYEVMEENM